jgi:flagellar hook protein FlgE
MLRSMFTAISALNQHQGYLDVVANNLANANTIGFKSARLLFQDQFSQLFSPGAAPTANMGGSNPTQIGLGVQTGYISPVFTQGALQSTGRNLDLAIQGDGFFIYGSGDQRRYSREGSLTIDSNSYIVNGATGMRLQGWTANATTGAIDVNAPVGDIQIPANQTNAQVTTTATLAGNLSPDVATNPVGSVVTVTLGAYDSLGNLVNVPIYFQRNAGTPLPAPGVGTNPASVWSYSTVAPVVPATVPPTFAGGTTPVAFDATGHLALGSTLAAGSPLTFVGTPGTGASGGTVAVDISSLTMLDVPNSAAFTSQNGLPAGSVSDIYVTPNDGSVVLVYSNGMRKTFGQVATAKFTNPAGLIRANHTMFSLGMNSGAPQVGAANTGGRGPLAVSSLEGSNVDMAQEFTNMILAQRGFQASSRVITTSDEIIQELVNLKR